MTTAHGLGEWRHAEVAVPWECRVRGGLAWVSCMFPLALKGLWPWPWPMPFMGPEAWSRPAITTAAESAQCASLEGVTGCSDCATLSGNAVTRHQGYYHHVTAGPKGAQLCPEVCKQRMLVKIPGPWRASDNQR